MFPRRGVLPLLGLLVCHGLLLPPVRSAPPSPTLRLTEDELAQREQRAEKDPVELLRLVSIAQEKPARRLRQEVKQLLVAQPQTATAAELDELASRTADVLPGAARSPADVREVLGPPQRVARQLLYRRYLEQWQYDTPLPLCVTFDCRKGQEPETQTVRPVPPRKP